ncbi:MAG TPA: tRNA pseudouridine(38-40) synthase TruA [Actinomycetota bacterium]
MPLERTIRMLIAYDGSGFRGWAAQRDQRVRTVEGVMTEVLTAVLGSPVRLSVAGRTDAGVHARGQVASFVTSTTRALPAIRDALNGRLAPEVVVRSIARAPSGFDARSSASLREYRYRIDVGDVPDPFTAPWVWHLPSDPDLRAMRTAARYLVGEHDFTSFCRHPGAGRPTVRDLQRVSVVRRGERLELGFKANAFLHQMVRALTGTLIAVGRGQVEPDAIPAILAARDRAAARHLAPPHGLMLERVVYGRRAHRERSRGAL